MNKEYYISMISKKLSNELNAAQLKDLNSWLLQSRGNSALADEFKNTWDLTAKYKQNVGFNATTAFESFSAKYDIGAKAPSTDKVVNKKSNKLKYGLLGLLLLSFISSGVFYYKNVIERTVSNSDMAAMTIKLNDASSITLAPNSKYLKGSMESFGSVDASESQTAYISESNGVKVNDTNTKTGNELNESADPTTSNATAANATGTASGEMITVDFDKEIEYTIEKFEGQAFFDLKTFANQEPLIIGVDGADNLIAAKDGAFNISNYSEDESSIIDVQSGTVTFYTGEEPFIIKEGERAIFNKKDGTLIRVKTPASNPSFEWHKGVLAFDNTPVDQAFLVIERFYGIDIKVVDDSSLENIAFTAANLKSVSLNECLELLHESIDMTIIRNGMRTVEISNVKSN